MSGTGFVRIDLMVFQRTASDHIAASLPSIAIYMSDLSGGGVERQVITLAQGMQAAGFSVVLLVHKIRGELRDKVPATIRVIDLQSRDTLRDIPPLVRFLRHERPSILLSNLDHNNVVAVVAGRLSATRTRVIICQHNSLSRDFTLNLSWSYRLIPFLYRLLSPWMDAAVAVSQGIANELCTRSHIPKRKVKLIHNAVIGDDFRLHADQPTTHRWLGNPEVPVFVTAGRLVPVKDHEVLLRALALYRRHRPANLIILGNGPLRDELGALATQLGIADAVDFLGFQENPLPFFRCADAFVLSSYSEGFGNVLVEAMGCGTPVISTDCEHGPAEILDHGRYGALVPPRCPQALADALDTGAALRKRWPPELLKARAAEFSTAACVTAYINLCCSLGSSRLTGPVHHPDGRSATKA
jgi:glycosyltransferase involved in cell wall biosynthesis